MNKNEIIELKTVVRRTMEEQLEMYSEVWLTEKELCKVFGTLKPSWLEKYRSALYARGCAVQPAVIDERGKEHRTGWTYARNKIQRLFATGEIEHLQCKAMVMT